MADIMRIPLMVDGAGDHCLPKLYRQPCLFACPVPIWITLHAFAPFKVFNAKAPRALSVMLEIARVRCQDLRLQCGSVRIAASECVACGDRTNMHRPHAIVGSEPALSPFFVPYIIGNI